VIAVYFGRSGAFEDRMEPAAEHWQADNLRRLSSLAEPLNLAQIRMTLEMALDRGNNGDASR
jgi:hypothetical protein